MYSVSGYILINNKDYTVIKKYNNMINCLSITSLEINNLIFKRLLNYIIVVFY